MCLQISKNNTYSADSLIQKRQQEKDYQRRVEALQPTKAETKPQSEKTAEKDKPKFKKVNWEILPPGKHPFERIKNYFKSIKSKSTHHQIDMFSIKKIYELGPDAIYFQCRFLKVNKRLKISKLS